MPGARGEAIIQSGEREERILFTMRALAEAERQAGKPISVMLSDQGFGIQECAILLRAGLEAARRDARLGGTRVTLQAAYDLLEEIGFGAAGEAIGIAVAGAIAGSGEENDRPNP
jgi:hypothetical protein